MIFLNLAQVSLKKRDQFFADLYQTCGLLKNIDLENLLFLSLCVLLFLGI